MLVQKYQVMQPVCDFCAIPGEGTTYVSKPSEVKIKAEHLDKTDLKSMAFEYSPEWNACAECAALIDAGEWEKLLDRTLTIYKQTWQILNAEHEKVLRDYVREIHHGFRTGLQGKREKPTELSEVTSMLYEDNEIKNA